MCHHWRKKIIIKKATIRWFLSGKHSKDSEEFGKKTDKDLFIMGIKSCRIKR
jgi:hypothetical protein